QPVDQGFQQGVTAAQAAIPDQLKAKVASECLMYVQPEALSTSPDMMSLNAVESPKPAQIYVAQVGYWIQEDVINSLAAANKGATSVKDAPVKHLWKIQFSNSAFAQMTSANPPTDAGSQSTEPTSPWKLSFANSPSGRETNGIYDVYRFGLRLFVDASQID